MAISAPHAGQGRVLARVCCRLRARVQVWRSLIQPARPTRFSRFVAIILALALFLINATVIAEVLALYHATTVSLAINPSVAMQNGQWLFHLEQRLHLDIEPAFQQQVSKGIATPWGVASGPALERVATWIYINAMPTWLFAALAWTYLFRRSSFGRLRNVTLVSGLLSIACYCFFPVAPPRFTLADAPYYLQDWTHGGGPLVERLERAIGYDAYAAFPSVHTLWALIPALCLMTGCRRPWARAAALLFPVAMVLTVVSTGNHYLLDCVGALAILAISYLLTSGVEQLRARLARRYRGGQGQRQGGYNLPAALSLALICAAMLAVVGIRTRVLIALAILLIIVLAAVTSKNLWTYSYTDDGVGAGDGGYAYLAGLLFVTGSTAAVHTFGADARWCAYLWLLASIHSAPTRAGAPISGSWLQSAPWPAAVARLRVQLLSDSLSWLPSTAARRARAASCARPLMAATRARPLVLASCALPRLQPEALSLCFTQ